MNIIIAGTVILAFINDSTGTVYLLANTVSVRGITWIAKKITENINLDASQMIDFAGWSIAGVSIVKIISKAINSVDEVQGFFISIAEYMDKVTFWN